MLAEEEKIQSECVKWFWNNFHAHRQMLFHVDNNSWNAIVGAKKKALGVCRGPSDLILVCHNLVLFLECKTQKGEQLQEQIEFQNKVELRGHIYIVFRSFNEFKEIIWQAIGKY